MFTLAKAIIASGALIYGAANVEQASEHFNDFAMQIPGVLGK
ncbi:MAG: hypothetical protein Q8K07_14920 [Methylicorpusculum sp.]|nr:hypothetical protein [Methylicorpusculum sp.]MDO9238982.1 hypothetical protein [Methylicorpusculum sp.]MDP2203315.1 hypothetical protein [Methylicorpusculum sp.]